MLADKDKGCLYCAPVIIVCTRVVRGSCMPFIFGSWHLFFVFFSSS